MQQRALFADSFVYQPSIFRRLLQEGKEAVREFSQDPSGYIESAIKGDSHHRRRIILCLGVVISAVPVVSALVIFGKVLLVLMLSLFGWQPAEAADRVLSMRSQNWFCPTTWSRRSRCRRPIRRPAAAAAADARLKRLLQRGSCLSSRSSHPLSRRALSRGLRLLCSRSLRPCRSIRDCSRSAMT